MTTTVALNIASKPSLGGNVARQEEAHSEFFFDSYGDFTTSNEQITKQMPAQSYVASTTCTSDFCCNQQYSVTAITTAAGAIAERYAYTAYGLPTILDASASVLSSSAISNRYTYTGREWDATLGLHHFRARWMSPIAGRFLGRDPIGYEGGDNTYRFVSNRPFHKTDPMGRIEILPGVINDSVDSNCASGPGKRKRMIVGWKFRAENRCPSGKGWIVQQVDLACSIGECPNCPKDAGESVTFFEAWRVSSDLHIPDTESMDGDQQTDVSEILIPFGTCGHTSAVGIVQFFCDEDLPDDNSNPSKWRNGLPPFIFADKLKPPCSLPQTGLPSTTHSPQWWGGFLTREAVGWRSHKATWHCCDCGKPNFVNQSAFPV